MEPFDIRCEASISAAGVRRIRQGHLWIYASDVVRGPAERSAAIVRVTDAKNACLGYAFHSAASQIRLRLLTRDEAAPTQGWLRAGIEASIKRRGTLEPGEARRLIFGEADLLPSIIVDRYADCLVLQTLSRGADQLKQFIVEALNDIVKPVGIVERNDIKARTLEGMEQKRGVICGSVPEAVEIDEGGIRFLVDISGGQKTGFFLDQRENRIAARAFASGRALDCFTNTGAFALHFARNCPQVIAVDTSAPSLEQAAANARLNGIENVEFREGNVFDVLRGLERAEEQFDTICLDPPAFAKNRATLAAARGGYKEINLRAMKLLRPEGVLVTSSCSYHLSEADFYGLIAEAANDAKRYVQAIERRAQAGDHPVLAGMRETHYLKCFILRVM